jgi:hypothetical protein
MPSKQIVFRSTDTAPKVSNPFPPAAETDDTDQAELTPEQGLACFEAVQAAVAAGTVIDAMLLQDIAAKALAGEALASANPSRARRRALKNYFGLPG